MSHSTRPSPLGRTASSARFFLRNSWLLLQRRLASARLLKDPLGGAGGADSQPGAGAAESEVLADLGAAASPTALYLDLMKRILANVIYSRAVPEKFDVRLRERIRRQGGAWPRMAHTMIGLKRLNNLQFSVEDVIARGVPGDLIETGVWRGGACIFMRAILKAHGVLDRTVWVADSFEGLPRPSADKYPADAGLRMHTAKALAVSVEEVKANFKEYGLLDEQVRFLKGWFRDSLPTAPIKHLAVLRLDGDMYESTMDALVNLYPRLSTGGYLIVDDYGAVPGCRQAVEDFRLEHGITEPLREIDWTGSYWQRTR
ncbi:MAG TPA: TylF/MycF family methyltransferase, partial [Dongiaceae bacterium]|nr:TylF/MycF family methyltransferase [Dongiaceae bacterium]